jgi:prepilin-type N-terminal cleavage/methylation domain-containing protein
LRPRSIIPSFFAARAARRGFTLIELSVVVVIVSVFAALAIPQVTRQLRDRRVQETAQRVLSTYQQARQRAIGSGGAVLVRYDLGPGGQGRLQVFEGRVGATVDPNERCPFLPNPSCNGVNWSNTTATGSSFLLSTWDLSTDSFLQNVFIEMFQDPTSDSGASTTFADICFTPLGRTFVGYTAGAATMTPLTNIPMAEVFRTVGSITDTRIGLTRRVVLLPNGGGRLEAELLNEGGP